MNRGLGSNGWRLQNKKVFKRWIIVFFGSVPNVTNRDGIEVKQFMRLAALLSQQVFLLPWKVGFCITWVEEDIRCQDEDQDTEKLFLRCRLGRAKKFTVW